MAAEAVEQISPKGGLNACNFKPISERGFGDPFNSYPHSMVWFNDYLYVGTTRAHLYLL